MKYNKLFIRFEGNKFYPSILIEKTGFALIKLAEPGEISTKGRYKGQFSPYGMAVLEISIPEKLNNIDDLIGEYCDKLLEKKNLLASCGVEEIIFDIECINNIPSEISFTKNIASSLSELNAKVEFHSINNTNEIKHNIEMIKNKFPFIMKEDLYQTILRSFKNHPLIYKADALYFIIYLLSKNDNSIKYDEDLKKFEDFYNQVMAV